MPQTQAQQAVAKHSEDHQPVGSKTISATVMTRAARRSRAASTLHRKHAPRELTASEQADYLVTLFEQGKFEEVERAARVFTIRFPREPFGWKILAASFAGRNEWQAAIELYERSADLSAGDWQFHNNFANALKTVGRLNQAETQYRHAIALRPGMLEPHYNLGLTLIDGGRLQEAETCLLQALSLQPDHGLAHLNLADILKLQSRLPEAENHYRHALTMLPKDVKLLNNFGQLRGMQRRFAEAESFYRQAIDADPRFAKAYVNLSELMATHGYVRESEVLLRHALTLEPGNAQAHSNLLFTLCHMEQNDPGYLFTKHRAFAAHFELPVRFHWPEHSNTREPERTLRIGFVSADLRDHPVMRYLQPALERLTGYSDLVLYAYNNNTRQDAETMRYRQLFHHWREVMHLSDELLSQQIQSDAIDILIDLSGHSGYNRLPVFARKPAPVQMSWIGYVGTSGLDAMDYFIADAHLVPEGLQSQFTEKIIYLPATTVFQPCGNSPEVNNLPALTRGVFTFSSLARANKFNQPLVALWAEILRKVPASRLLLSSMPGGNVPRLLVDWFAGEGIPRGRLVFAHARSVDEVLVLQHEVDLCLDTFPYNGSTSNNHSLWMGVPTLTLAGATAPGRMGTALAQLVGLEEFVAEDKADFVAKAVYWAEHPQELAELRTTLRGRFADSIFQKPEVVIPAFVQALRGAWRRWCAGVQPESF